MINFYNQVPTIYSAASRDFQYLSWLINIVLNSVKHNVDSLYDLPNSKVDPRLSELLAFTLGFKVKRNYDKDQLIALVSLIPRILKCKGTETAIKLVGHALIRSSGARGECNCKIENNQVIITLPKELIDITLFIDILPYILPAGCTCKINRTTEMRGHATDEVHFEDTILAALLADLDIDSRNEVFGLAGIRDGQEVPTFANYIVDYDGKPVIDINGEQVFSAGSEPVTLNDGLLSNTIIPALTKSAWADAVLEEQTGNLIDPALIKELTNVLGKIILGKSSLGQIKNNKTEQ
jgi:hypothetical protein